MTQVYLFVSNERFHSEEELDSYVDRTYTEDGEGIDSAFMTEVGLTSFESACIDASTINGSGLPKRMVVAYV